MSFSFLDIELKKIVWNWLKIRSYWALDIGSLMSSYVHTLGAKKYLLFLENLLQVHRARVRVSF
jgi:hypothetical protein